MASASITAVANEHDQIPLVKGVPILGCLPEFAKDPLAFFRDLATQHEDIVEFRFGTMDIALVTSASLSHQILVKEVKNFRKADREINILSAFIGNGLVTNNDTNDHKKQRKLVQPGFHFRKIQGYAQTMIDYTDRYLADWENAQRRDISDDMFRLTMYIVSKTLFNTDMEQLENNADTVGDAIGQIQRIADQRFNQLFQIPKWIPTPNNLREKKINASLRTMIRDMIQARTRADGSFEDGDDLMAMLLNARYEDGSAMSEQQIMDELITLFIAGHETTSNSLTWTLYLLSQHRDIQTRLQAELDEVMAGESPTFEDLEKLTYTEMVIKEAMRMFPPAWTLSARQSNSDIVIDGYFIPKDKTLFISPYANHYNPRYFNEPDRFDPERFTPEREKSLPRFAYMPFGAGPRVCIGNSFAMMEAKLILATLVKRFNFELCPDQAIQPQPQITLSNEGGMHMQITAR
ncbi:MAG: cytochrome P450 [Oleiphilaceae bacterium]|nr:cytochrome P450 [Oleiphilaceae bacterium]